MADTVDVNKELMTSESQDGETEAIHTMGLGGIDNSSFQLTVEKLNEKNFREWA